MTLSKLAIIGPGLLGGSIALAVRNRRPETHVAIWARREEIVEDVLKRKIADFSSTNIEAVTAGADVVVLCVPIGAMVPLAERMVASVSAETLITDVGSVKAPVVAALSAVFARKGRFIGSHPMAGSEQTGIDAARGDLFEGSVCIVTPEEKAVERDVRAVCQFWSMLGGVTRILSPEDHDASIALVSHLPHLLAATLVNLVCAQNPNSLNFCGNGFRDVTRVASGSPGMWTEIFGSNREQLRTATQAMIDKLGEVVRILDDNTKMHQFLTEAKINRDPLKKGQN